MKEIERPQFCLLLNNNTKLELKKDNSLVLISPNWDEEVEIGYCNLTDPKRLRFLLENFSVRVA